MIPNLAKSSVAGDGSDKAVSGKTFTLTALSCQFSLRSSSGLSLIKLSFGFGPFNLV